MHRQLLSTLAATALLAVTAAHARPPTAPPNMDSQSSKRIFAQADSDGSGTVSLGEMLAAKELEAERHFGHLLRRFDIDQSGDISFAEAQEAGDRPHDDIDIVALRACVREALPDAPEAPADPEGRFEDADMDGSGVVDAEEFAAAAAERAEEQFERVDANDDQQISKEEFAEAARALRTLTRAIHECTREQIEAGGLLGGNAI